MTVALIHGRRADPLYFLNLDHLAGHLLALAGGRTIDLLPQTLDLQDAPDLPVLAVFAPATDQDRWLGWTFGDAADADALRAALDRPGRAPFLSLPEAAAS